MTGMLVVTGVALTIGALVTWMWARGQGWRWGWDSRRSELVGDGLYRSAPFDIRTPRRMPKVCAAASVTSVAWGSLMTFVFAPAGLLAALLMIGGMIDEERGPDLIVRLICLLPFAAVAAHGFVQGTRLMALVSALTVRSEYSRDRVERAATTSIIHHVVVASSFALACLGMGVPHMAWVAAVPCALGLLHARLLVAARVALTQLDTADADRAVA
jgi:hypothetical protein